MRNLISKKIQFLLLTLFFFSGISALVYEVVFSKSLGLIFGTTTYAISTILAIFMAGLALGSFLFGKMVDRYRNPLIFYALLELGIGLYCLFTPLIFKGIEILQIGLWQKFQPSFSSFNFISFGLSFLSLIIPTTLMGGTLPVISKFFILQKEKLGKKVGLLYFVNTFGAVLGSFLASFILIVLLGVSGTIYTAAGLNILIGILVFGLAMKQKSVGPFKTQELEASIFGGKRWLPTIVLIGFFFSGFAALALEVLWTRVLVMILGSSVYAFSIMLCTFLFGIAFGSLIVAKWIDQKRDVLLYFALTQILIGFLVLLLTPLFDNLPFLFLKLLNKFRESFWALQIAEFFFCFLVMFLPTLLMGATFPIVTKIYTQNLKYLGCSIGKVYAANTTGSVLGSLAAGFLLIPLIGLQKSIVLVATIYFTIGALILILSPIRGQIKYFFLAFLVILVFLGFYLPSWNKNFLNSGVFIYGDRYLKRISPGLVFYKEGISANVAVRKSSEEELSLQINGKTDASSKGDLDTELLSGHLPLILHPEPKEVLVIGLGSGITLGAVEQYPLEKIEAVEIEKAVVEAAEVFSEHNNNALKDPRLKMIIGDGRHYLLNTSLKYDVITSEPSNPWFLGNASLFTKEYYLLAREHLKEEGLFIQWVHLYNLSLEDVKMVLRTFQSVFPHTTLWSNLNQRDLLLVGSLSKLEIDFEKLSQKFKEEKIKNDLKRINIESVSALMGYFLLDEKAVSEFVQKGALHSDNYPFLEFSAPKSFYFQTVSANLKSLKEFQTSPLNLLTEIDSKSKKEVEKYFEFRKKMIEAAIYYENNEFEKATPFFEEALAFDPSNQGLKELLVENYLQQGKILQIQGKNEEALSFYQKGEVLGVKKAKILGYLGEVYIKLEKISEAESYLRRSIELDPEDSDVHMNLGVILGMQKKYEEAEKELKKAIELDPQNYISHNNLAHLYQLLADFKKAEEEWLKSLKINPNQPIIKKLLKSKWRAIDLKGR